MLFQKRLLAISMIGLMTLAIQTFAQSQPPLPRDADPRATDPRATDPRAAVDRPQERRPDVMGRITSVSPDGRTLTLASPPTRPGGGASDQPAARPEPATILLTDRTQTLFFGVGEGEARPAQGMMAMVWLEPSSKDQAARVRFMKREGEERPDIQGRILSVSADARTITVETRDDRGDRPTGKIDLHLAPYTQSLYYGVDKDAARPTPDYQVVAWLEKGSKDTPVRIRFMKSDARDLAPGATPAPRP
jgi:hypothetical protein